MWPLWFFVCFYFYVWSFIFYLLRWFVDGCDGGYYTCLCTEQPDRGEINLK